MILSQRKKIFSILSLFIISIVVLPLISSAQTIVPQIDGLTTADIRVAAGSIIQLFLGLLGLIALIIVLIAGFKWMTSGGNEEKISEAKKMLVAGVIGLVIILSAYAITTFILNEIQGALEGEDPDPQNCSANVCYGCNRCNSSGDGYFYDSSCSGCNTGGTSGGFELDTIWHSPSGNDVSLCSMVQVKFNATIDSSSLTADNFKFFKCLDYVDGECVAVSSNLVTDVNTQLSLSSSEKIIKFTLGEDYETDTYYVVDLPINGIKQLGADNYLSTGLTWTFKTGNLTDNNSPTVINVFPGATDEVCLNSYIAVEFSEDMDLESLENPEAFRLYNNLSGDLSNIEFSHSAQGNELILQPDRNYLTNHDYFPSLNGDIVKDACGNYLDGDGDTNAEGSPEDDYPSEGPSLDWTFTTGENEYCEPQITSISPDESYYDSSTSLTITGHYLSGGTTLVFDDGIVVNESSNLCLDNDYWPEGSCEDGIWQVDEIKVFVPAAGGNSWGTRSGNVNIEIQTDQGLTTGDFNLISPRINSLSPDSGGAGQYITLSGLNFGETNNVDFTASAIFFRSSNNEYIEADLPCGEEGWQGNQIIISAPESLEISNNPYRVQVKRVLNDGSEHWSNLVDFTITDDEIGPGLCSINVDEIEYNDEFTLSGFKLGNVNSEDRKVVLGDDYNSVSSQVISWGNPSSGGQDTTVSAITPNLSSADNTGVRAAVKVDGEWKFSNYLNVDISSVLADEFYISYIDPTEAAIGEYITIYGSGFGNSQPDNGGVKFFSNTGGGDGFGLDGDFSFPSACSSVYWQNDQVIVKIPEGFNITPFASKIKIVDDQTETNEVDFQVNDESPAPSICSVNPDVASAEEEIEIVGEYLNNVDLVTFAYGTSNSEDVIPDIVDDNLMTVNVPETETGLISAHNSNGYGNTWNFEYAGVSEGPQEIWDFYGWEFRTCDRCDNPRVRIQACSAGNNFSPSPASGNMYVPLDSNIYVEFEYSDGSDAEMNTNTYQNNFQVYDCGDEENPLDLGDCNILSNDFEVGINYLSIYNVNLEASHWYVVELTDNILDVENSSLNEYSWYFRIDPYGSVCEPTSLSIEPSNFSSEYSVAKHIPYVGLLVDRENCYVCNSEGYDYEWESDNVDLATIESPSNAETDVVLNDSYNIGSVRIKATSTLDSLELYDETDLFITANCSFYDGEEDMCLDESDSFHSDFDCCWDAYNGSCENVGDLICNSPFVRNRDCEVTNFGGNPVLASPSPQENTEYAVTDSHIYAEFAKSNVDVVMDSSTFEDGITILNCGNGITPELICSETGTPVITSTNGGDNFVNYEHSGFSDNTWYKVILDDSIADIYGNTIIPRTWTFKTNTDVCITENISLQPSSITLQIGEDSNMGVVCYDNSCNVCDDIYTYDWNIDDISIAELDQSNHSNFNSVEGITVGNTEVEVVNNELNINDISSIEVILGGSGLENECSLYIGSEQCNDINNNYHPDFDCCWAEENCYSISDPICGGNYLDAIKTLSFYPNDGATDICLNTVLEVVFDKPLNPLTINDNISLVSGGSSVPVDFDIYENWEGNGVLKIYPQELLEQSLAYKVTLTDGLDGIKSIYGDQLSCSMENPCEWTFTTANDICDLSYVHIIDPENYYEFNSPGIIKEFVVEARSINGEEITPIADVYDWQWQWESLDESLVTLNNNNSVNTNVVSANRNGTTRVRVTALPIPDESVCYTYNETVCESNGCCWVDGVCSADLETCEQNLANYNNKIGYKGVGLQDEVEVKLFMCENPWEFEDNDYNFKLSYCRDGNLPYLDDTPIIRDIKDEVFNAEEVANGLLREYIFKYINPIAVNNLDDIQLADARSDKSMLAELGWKNLTDDRLGFNLIQGVFKKLVSNFLNQKVLAVGNENPNLSNSSDIIGLRIYQNLDHKSPIDWYDSSNVISFQGSPNSFKIDNYDGLRDGRTVYVNNANVSEANIYTNISLLSHNQNPSIETDNIFNQLIDNWIFNINIAPEQKNKIIEDVIRWQDLRTTEKMLDNYASQHKYCAYVTDPVNGSCPESLIDYYHFDIDGDGIVDSFNGKTSVNQTSEEASECYNVSNTVTCNSDVDCQNHEMGFDKCVGIYPEINEGTYVRGVSTSVWPSWVSTLSNILGFSLPSDPVNDLGECIDPLNPLISYDERTCWSVDIGSFFCPMGSRFYYYEAGNNYNIDRRALNFNLYSLFNFSNDNNYYWSGYSDNNFYNSAFYPYNSININNNDVCNDQISTTCGNGIREGNEECEAGDQIVFCSGSINEVIMGCRMSDCQWPSQPESCLRCGDGIVSTEYGEECELGWQKNVCQDSWNPQTISCGSDCQWLESNACRYCGNGICENGEDDPLNYGENEENCYVDCGSCGNGVCESNENPYSCYVDCGFCGDGTVSGREECDWATSIGEECENDDGYPGHIACSSLVCPVYSTQGACLSHECCWQDIGPAGICTNDMSYCDVDSGCLDHFTSTQCEVDGDCCWSDEEGLCLFKNNSLCKENLDYCIWTDTCLADGECGNEILEGGELCEIGDIGPQCDNGSYYGNLVCSSTILSDLGDPIGPDDCVWSTDPDVNCDINQFCGDGIVNGLPGVEQCDDGNKEPGDGCSYFEDESEDNCKTEECGDEIVGWSDPDGDGIYTAEDCDDGNPNNNDQCHNDCTFTFCGDGIVQNPNGEGTNEVCDTDTPQICNMPDGYAGKKTCNNCTGWSNCVATEWCGDGIVNGSPEEECDFNDPNSWDPTQGQACNNFCDIVINLNILQIKPSNNAIDLYEDIIFYHEDDDEFSDSFGSVTVVNDLIDDFNSDPESYLPVGNRLENHNVLVFGWKDCNNNKDLSLGSAQAVADFIDEGGAVIFGHDTFWNEPGNVCGGTHVFFNSLMNYAGIKGMAKWAGTSQACTTDPDGGVPFSGNYITGSEAPVSNFYDGVEDNDPLLGELMYTTPYDLTNASPIEVLNTHPSCQVLNQTYCLADDGLKIWFTDDEGDGISWANTCGKVEMIQLGHTTGVPNEGERKALINMLYYIATGGEELILNGGNMIIEIEEEEEEELE